MTIESLNKRLSRMHDAASPTTNFALSLQMARARQKAREDEWRAAGNTGPVPREPPKPLSPPHATARRYDREMWRKLATIRARELDLHLNIGRMSDDDLHRAITDAESTDVRQ